MPLGLWLSIGLGAGIGAVYGALALLNYRYALQFRGRRFMAVAFGGMLGRMVLLFVVVLSAALWIPVHVTGFIIALVAVVIVSLVLEVIALMRWL